MIQQRSVANLIAWHQRVYKISPTDRATQVSALAFDAAVWEIWPYLVSGASVWIANPETRLSPVKLLKWLRNTNITLCFLPTPLAEVVFTSLVNEGQDGFALRALLTGGDRLSRSPERPLPFELLNHYGPTEATVVATRTLVASGGRGGPPIGKPIDNSQVVILDRNLQLTPVGVPGELCIGGVGLARGYFARPSLTADKFIPNPFSSKAGARLYRTGDLARYLPDGNLEYLGRIDQQVKIRAHRIELGEIESVLNEHPSVRASAVVVREGTGKHKRLASYLVARTDAAPPVGELRLYLKQKLPDYMVPATFEWLKQLPMTPNGKVDRNALTVPDDLPADRSEPYLAPRTQLEELLTNVWGEILCLEKIGIHDNFFELGGHSLLATRVVSRLRSILPVDVSVRSLFETPTVANLAQKMEWAMGRKQLSGCEQPMRRALRIHSLRLSYAQQRLWFLDQLQPGSSVYNIATALQVEGRLDLERLRRSLEEIVRRHEVLRTRVVVREGEPVQEITAAQGLALAVVDLRALPEEEREARARQLTEEEAGRPFDLGQGPLLRTVVLQLGREQQVLILNLHHIIADGWSLEVLWRELGRLYEGYEEGKGSPLEELPIQYADYGEWQREWLQGGVLEEQLSYWKKQLQGLPGMLELPTDRPRPALQSFRGAKQTTVLPGELAEGLKGLSRRAGTTLFMTLLAAFQVLLARASGQVDFAVGVPIANRNRVELEGLIGFFVNTLVMRSELSGEPSFRELLQRVREAALSGYAHQDLPFEKLVEEMQPERNLSHLPLFQVMFDVQNSPMPTWDFGGFRITQRSWRQRRPTAICSSLLMWSEPGLVVTIEYNTDLFDAATIVGLQERYRKLLEEVVADEERCIWGLPILSAGEQQQMAEWNRTEAGYPGEKTVVELFEEQVERTPGGVAVVFEGEELSYGELNGRANQLAHYLRGLGVGREVLVGICVERSLEMVVGLLGVLKAGGAYVPLDPSYPPERLRYMVEDAQATVVLTQERLRELLPEGGARVVLLDGDWEQVQGQSVWNPESAAGSDNLAYVIYTSGSTGKPKGAMNSLRAISNRLLWMQEAYALDGSDRVLQKTPFSFDVSVWEFFWPLITGACLVVARPGGHREAAYLTHLIQEQQITTLHFVPSMLEVFLRDGAAGQCSSLRRVMCSGEALTTGLTTEFFSRLGCELHNLYGPTEAAVDVTCWQCQAAEKAGTVPIGKPIANLKTYVLDGHGQPVPVGVTGELYLGGVGVGRGYLRRPELTAEKFMPDPFSSEGGARLYRTGDLARYRPDGNLEFMGRADQQVKIRGNRIELGEIEAVLQEHTEIRQAAVVAREDEPGDKRLIAYVVGCDQQAPTIADMRRYLAERLPDYMMPSRFVTLKAIPLTPNGKLDRQALPLPEQERSVSPRDFVAPRDVVELQLARIWEETLNVRPVGVHDDFFELGGHSLLAVQVVARIKERFGQQVPLAALFEGPTVERQAESLRRGSSSAKRSALVAIQAVGEKPPLFLIHPAGGNVMCYYELARHLRENQPVYGLVDSGFEDAAISVEEMGTRYLEAIRVIQPAGPYRLGGWSMGGLVAFEMAQQLRERGEKVQFLAILDVGAAIHQNGETLDPVQATARALAWVGRNLEVYSGKDLGASDRDLQSLSADEQQNYILKRMKAQGFVPPDIEISYLRGFLKIYENNVRAALDYVPKSYPDRITLFRGMELLPGSDEKDAEVFRNPDLGWQFLSPQPVDIHRVPGNHMTIVTMPNVQTLAKSLSRCLEEGDTN